MAKISTNNISRAIYLASKDGADMSVFYKNTVKFLARKRLLTKSKDILLKLNKIINEEHGVIEVKVKSAKKLHEEVKKEIIHLMKKRYEAKEVFLEESLDERLLGGVHIQVNDEVIDLSLKNKMNKLQAHLTRT